MKRFCVMFYIGVLAITAGMMGGCSRNQTEELGKAENPVVALIGKILPDSAAERRKKLEEQLLNPDADIRREGVLSLSKTKGAEVEQIAKILMIMAMDDPDEQVRASAVSVLAKLDKTNAIIDLLDGTSKDKSVLVRRESVAALGERVTDDSMTVLLDMLREEKDDGLRGEVARVLREFKHRKVVRGLVSGLGDDAFAVVYQSRDSLVKLTGKDFDYDQDAWEKWLSETDDPIQADEAD